MFGNHDFYNFSRNEVHTFIPDHILNMGITSPVRLYYDFKPCDGVRFIVLDPFEISTMAGISSSYMTMAEELISSKNKNLSVPNSDWSHGLSEEDLKYVPYNGSLGHDQLLWLKATLQDTVRMEEICFIFSHISVYKDCVRPSGLVWNHDDVLDVIHTYGDRVAAVISGHDHDGGYALDEHGVHHIVPPAPLECELDEEAFGFISVYESSFNVSWFGRAPRFKTIWPHSMPITRKTT